MTCTRSSLAWCRVKCRYLCATPSLVGGGRAHARGHAACHVRLVRCGTPPTGCVANGRQLFFVGASAPARWLPGRLYIASDFAASGCDAVPPGQQTACDRPWANAAAAETGAPQPATGTAADAGSECLPRTGGGDVTLPLCGCPSHVTMTVLPACGTLPDGVSAARLRFRAPPALQRDNCPMQARRDGTRTLAACCCHEAQVNLHDMRDWHCV
jgi:hypothetical protein